MSGKTFLALMLSFASVAFAGELTPIPMSEKGTSTYFVTAEIGSEQVEFLVDTGAGYTTINQELLRRLQQNGNATHVGEIEGILANGAICILPVYRIRSLVLGNCVLHNIEVAQTPSDARNLLGLSALKKAAPFTFSMEPAELQLSNCSSTIADETKTAEPRRTGLSSLYQ